MMPTHIITEGRRYKKTTLAREALRRARVQIEGEQITGITARSTKPKQLYDHNRSAEICKLADGSIDTSLVQSKKERESFRNWLCHRGMVRLRTNLYAMPPSVDADAS